MEEDQGVSKKSRFDKIWDRVIDIMYDTFDDFAEQTVDVDQPVIVEPLNMKTSVQFKTSLNSFLVCSLLITFANSLDPDQDRQNVSPDLNPNCLTLQ